MTLNELSRQTFVQYFGGLYEHSAWIVERAFDAGLTLSHNDPDLLCKAFQDVLALASEEEKLGLINAHPDLVGNAGIAGELTEESTLEQGSAGLNHCSKEEFSRFTELNSAYKEKFKFPFIMAVREKNRSEILVAFDARIQNSADVEFARALSEINQIARLRLDVLLKKDPNGRFGYESL